MREIKFRCWDIVFNKMRYEQDLWDIAYNELFIHTPDQRALNLMQYTGLKDINDKEIYEGDIIKIYDIQTGQFSESTHVIIYNNKSEWTIDDYWLLSRKHHKCKVIGNIYENKELLDN